MRILMSMFGWNDIGGGTSYPRQFAVNLVKLGHEVTVFYAAVHEQTLSFAPAQHHLVFHQQDGVNLVAVKDRPGLFLDVHHPERERDCPPIVDSFKQVFDQFQPDIVHYHNFLGLSAEIADIAYQAGIPSLFSAHNFWFICPTLYLQLPDGQLCTGVNDTGSNCLNCAKSYHTPWQAYVLPPAEAYVQRMQNLRELLHTKINRGLCNAKRVQDLFVLNGYSADKLQIQKLSNPRSETLWEALGKHKPRESSGPLQIAYMGQVISLKGVHLLVQAAQELIGDFEVSIFGLGSPPYIQELKQLDKKERVRFYGAFTAEQQIEFLATIDVGVMSSIAFDHSPLVISEFLSAGIPVISADIGGAPDYIQPDSCLLFAPGDLQALTAHLQSLLDHPEKLRLLKSKIVQPPLATDYIKAVLQHFKEVRAQSQETNQPLFAHLCQRFLSQRQTGAAYQAVSLWPTPSEAGLVDLFNAHDLSHLSEQITASTQLISPSQSLIEAIAPRYKVDLVLLSYPQAPIPFEDLPDHLTTVLLPMSAAVDWQGFLAIYLALEQPDFLPVLVPWQLSSELAQQALLSYLEAENHDLEAINELLIMEQKQALDFFRQADLIFLGDLLTEDLSLLYGALLGKAVCLRNPSASAKSLYQLSPQSDWQDLAEVFACQIYQPRYTPEQQSEIAAQQLSAIIGI